jgi:hypothetical protein
VSSDESSMDVAFLVEEMSGKWKFCVTGEMSQYLLTPTYSSKIKSVNSFQCIEYSRLLQVWNHVYVN